MATATAFNSLVAPASDMEMSSPANRPLDDDIDIDFDDYPGGVHVADDEQMIEDGDPARPNTGTDDMMEDDILPGEQIVVEEEVNMQHDGVQVQEMPPEDDEELIDYGDDEIHEAVEEETVIPEEIEEPQESADATETGPEQEDEDSKRLPGFAIPAVAPPGLVEEGNEVEAQFPNQQDILEDLLDHTASLEKGIDAEVDAAFADNLSAFGASEDAVQPSQDALNAGPEADQAPISVNTALSTQVDTPGTPTDTGLHPMTIRYGDLRMPLFKSRRQPDGLLKDDNLASLSLAELIQNCRQRLALKIGEDISEDQELILGFEHLGMMLVEVGDTQSVCNTRAPLTVVQDSRAAFESSLNDILEVYLQLHRNDAASDIPALSLTLSLQLKFASSFSLLKNAAAGGQGMSSFGFLQPLGGNEFYHEEYDDDEGSALHGKEDDGQQTGEDLYDEHGQPLDQWNDDETGYYYEHNYDTEEGDHAKDSTGIHGDNENPPPPGFEELLHGENDLTDTVNSVLDTTAAAGKDIVSDSTAANLDAALGKPDQGLSQQSSQTEQGDHANTNAGEYDFIDFDDDTLTSELSAYTSSGHDDFSTFLTEVEAEEQGATLPKDDEDDPLDSDQTFDAQHLGSEDFLNDLGEHDYEGQDQLGEQGAEESYEPGDGYENYDEEESYDRADTYGEQQYEEDHPDYQPGDEDEQFHTAQQDFFQGDFREHGPEHDVHEEEEEGLDDTVNTVVHHEVVEEYQEDFEDDLGFDDDNFEQQEGDTEAIRPVASGSPLGNKRSFDDLADEDDLEIDERDVKKSRAS